MSTSKLMKRPRMRMLFSRKSLCIPYALFLILFVVLPLFIIVFYAFTDKEMHFTFDNFVKIFTSESNFSVIGMSLLIGLLNTVFCLLIGYPIAYLLANSRYNKNKILVYLFILPMWINFVIRTIATRDMLAWLDITSANHPLLATTIGMVYNYLPFAILPLYSTMLKLDKAQIEAASDLGANPVRVFIKAILPMSAPGITSACLMTFMPTMSSYVIADKLGGGKITLIGNLINLQFSVSQYNVGSVLALLMLFLIGCSLLITKNSKKEENVRGGLW